MKRVVFGVFILAVAMVSLTSISYAQDATAKQNAEFDKYLELMRQDLRSRKKQVVAANLKLTEAEATKFWPVYDQYTEDMRKQNDQFYSVIKDYAVNQETMTDAAATSLIKRWAGEQVQPSMGGGA